MFRRRNNVSEDMRQRFIREHEQDLEKAVRLRSVTWGIANPAQADPRDKSHDRRGDRTQ